MKMFISLPMNGRTDEEINTEIERVYRKYEGLTVHSSELLETFFDDEEFEDADYENLPLAYLAKSIDLLAQAEVAIFAKGWKESRGCRIEHQCAVDYEVLIIDEEEE